MAKTPAVGKKAAKTPKKVLYYSISIQYYLKFIHIYNKQYYNFINANNNSII